MILRLLLLSFVVSGLPGPAAAQIAVTNPYALYYGRVVRVIDGDTLDVRVNLWPGLEAIYAVRVRGIDAPELRRTRCAAERQWGEEAKAQVAKLYPPGTEVRLEDVDYDSFGGRVVADVRRWRSDRWLYLSDELVERGLAEAWTPGMADIDWCALAVNR
jgi:endonuclease YncB( thermonuclease family)